MLNGIRTNIIHDTTDKQACPCEVIYTEVEYRFPASQCVQACGVLILRAVDIL